MNWDALYTVLATACGAGLFFIAFAALGWSMAKTEDSKMEGPARLVLIAVIGLEAVLFVALLVAASQVPQ